MNQEEILQDLRKAISKLDNVARQCQELIEEQTDTDDIDDTLELSENITELQDLINNYQEKKGYI